MKKSLLIALLFTTINADIGMCKVASKQLSHAVNKFNLYVDAKMHEMAKMAITDMKYWSVITIDACENVDTQDLSVSELKESTDAVIYSRNILEIFKDNK